MQLIHFQITKSNDLIEFITFWSRLYSYANEKVYSNIISKHEFSVSDTQLLFEWKNGMRLSDLKQKSLEEKILKKIAIVNYFKSNKDLDLAHFNNEFKNLSAVWKIFLLHIIKPDNYPIYDQHIHRTFLFIHNEDFSSISNNSINDREKEQFYFEKYLPFINNNSIDNLKKLDEAFFAFGQFLNTKNYKTLFSK